ncbi:uncharacterized protein EKO05_0006808 [Ascochyta rabiei]|uniref:uncharacterized protein n=1 Tax=Didymella rabiei TaxID=5454 RepID=UPI00220BEA5D|nr:uncharacterized protein EKO05_0006808 [Ascochyta rabiei]UPX16405.1 hypothetical protein EKO05_0006808 [Ascochyta rabiei]
MSARAKETCAHLLTSFAESLFTAATYESTTMNSHFRLALRRAIVIVSTTRCWTSTRRELVLAREQRIHTTPNHSSIISVYTAVDLQTKSYPIETSSTSATMTKSTHSSKNTSNSRTRRIYSSLGFSKAYNFVFYFIFAGALLGFALARFMYLNFNGQFCAPNPASGDSAAPGECYYYTRFTRDKIGIMLHLAGILPASLLVVLQFTPFIRHRWILIHRISGYVAVLLYIVSLVGALMIARHAFGGGLDVQVWVGFVGIGVLICFILAIVNVKRLQIEQHRAWMLRGWFYAGSIITSRFVMIIAAMLVSNKDYYIVWPCAKIAATIADGMDLASEYPACASYADGSNLAQVSAVLADMDGTSSVNAGAALNVNFGMALWLAFAIHAVGIEVYLHLTPKEAERLRQVSYTRQLEAGMSNPGSAGLTADRLGDAEKWVAEDVKASNSKPAKLEDRFVDGGTK